MNRTANCERRTNETKIQVTLGLDGTGKTSIHTGIGFFDHMLDGFARHGLFDLTVAVSGDLEVDCHHTIEDTGIVLGQAIREAVGEMDTQLVREFFYAVSYSAMMNLHLRILDGENSHHMAEALFKSFGKALDMATMEEPRIKDAWTTKGSLSV